MLHLNDHLYSKPCLFLLVANFWGLTIGFARLLTLSRVFIVGHICITKNIGAFTRGGIYPYLTQHIFSFYCIQPCDLVGRCPNVPSPPNQTPNAVLIITMHSHPCHVLFPCITAKQCNAPLHVISCRMHNEGNMDTIPHHLPGIIDNHITCI